MLGSHSQTTQASTERSRPRSRLLMMKERLRLQRQRCQQQTSGNCQPSEAEQGPASATSESYPTADSTQTPAAVQSPIKGRRFQRSRHAEQQSRSRSQDAVTTDAKQDTLLGCTAGPRPLQKSKSVDMNLEKITQESGTSRRSNTLSVEVGKLAASGSKKVEKKGSFLFRSSSLLARLSGRSGQKKLQSPSPLRRDASASGSVENQDDSIGAGTNQSGTSSTLSKTVSLSEAGCPEVFMLSDSDGTVSRQQIPTASSCRPTIGRSHSDQGDQTSGPSLMERVDLCVCHCSAFVKGCHIPPTRADGKCHEKAAAAQEHGSEIVFAAEMRRGLPRQKSEDWIVSHSHADNCTSRTHGESEATKKASSARGRPISVSTDNLLKRMLPAREDFAGNSNKLNDIAVTPAVPTAGAMASCDPAALDGVTITTASAQEGQSEYS